MHMLWSYTLAGALVRSHQSTSAGSFGLVRPAWIKYARSAVPQDVRRAADTRPLLPTLDYVRATSRRRDATRSGPPTSSSRARRTGSRCCIISGKPLLWGGGDARQSRRFDSLPAARLTELSCNLSCTSLAGHVVNSPRAQVGPVHLLSLDD